MKFRFVLLTAGILYNLCSKSQIVLSENFDAPFDPAAAGWYTQNNSSPQGTVSWFQGTLSAFPSYNGWANDYFAVDFRSEAPVPQGGISNWLITPTVNLANNGVFSFATRTRGQYPDRLQVYYSTGTGTGAIASGTSALGTFTNLLTDINPALSPTPNGYPLNWTVYSFTLSNIFIAGPGRFAFRYFVSDGGFNGANSDYIGIDAVKYYYPCAQPVMTITSSSTSICSGQSVTLTASGASGYSWSPGAQTGSVITVTPASTTVYTLSGTANNCTGQKTLAINVTPTPTLTVYDATVCAGTDATLQASGAASYTWQPGTYTNQVIVTTPTANSTFTLTGMNGACQSTATANVVLSSSLGVLLVPSSSFVCTGNSAIITAYGGSDYTWTPGGSTLNPILITPTTNTSFTVTASSGTCSGSSSISIPFSVSPSLAISSSQTVACIYTSVQITGTGASGYTWTAAGNTYTSNPFTLYAGNASGTIAVNLIATAANGCTASSVFSQSVNTCVGLQEQPANENLPMVYPVPFADEITVSGFSGKIFIYDLFGKLILQDDVNEEKKFQTSAFAKGIYVLRMSDSQGKMTRAVKMVKN